MDIDEMRQNWSRMNLRLEQLEEANRALLHERSMAGKESTRNRLLRQYTVRTILCFVLIPVIVPQLTLWLGCPVWYAMLYGVGFLTFGLMTNSERRMIKDIDLSRMSVREVMKRVRAIEQVRRRHMITGYVIGAIILIPLIYFIYLINDRAMIIGCWVGAVIGLLIGLMVKKRCNELLKRMRENDISD